MSSVPLYNVSKITFADGSQEIMCSSRPVYRHSHKKHVLPVPGCREFSDDEKDTSLSWTPFGFAEREVVDDHAFFRDLEDSESCREDLDEALICYRKIRSEKESIRRARWCVEVIGRANQWDYFVTLTFDPAKVDSYDYYAVSQASRVWLKSMKRTNSSMEYLMVFEKHPSSLRYHIHGLLSGCSLHLVPSDSKAKRDSGIFNMPSDYDLGFTEVSLVRDSGKASRYLSKYIGKALGEVPEGACRYLVSRGLKRLDDVREIYLFDSAEELQVVLDTLHGIADRVSSFFVDVINTTFTYFKVFAPAPLPGPVAPT